MSKLSRFFIRGWNVVDAPKMTKALVVMAPHTSMIDFFHGKWYFSSYGYKPKFLMKKEMFWWPLSIILKKMGAVPIDRSKRVGQIRQVIDAFNSEEKFVLVMCPEGTRSKVKNWKRGFIKMAQSAEVPVYVGFIDYATHSMGIKGELDMSGTDTEIMNRLKSYYVGMEGRNKDCFDTGFEK